MIVSDQELALILNPKIRRRQLELPVQHGEFGERKRCQAKPGGVYQLRARVPYERYFEQARQAPTPARAVLALIALCEQPQKTVTVTVTHVELLEGSWLVRFVKGERELEQKPRLLAARPGGTQGDYTTIPSRAMRDTGEEVGSGMQEFFASAADEGRRSGANDQRDRLLAAVSTLRLESAKLNAGSSMARRRLKTIEHNLRALQHEWRRSA